MKYFVIWYMLFVTKNDIFYLSIINFTAYILILSNRQREEQFDQMKKQVQNNCSGLQPYLSPIAVWALSVGSAIGWGSLIVTSRTYLSEAGPWGSIIGLLIGFAMMMMVANHYHFLANRYPGTGGLYNYVKYVFGYDRAFLIAWFLFLIYIAIFWANATSIPLFTRYFLGGVVASLGLAEYDPKTDRAFHEVFKRADGLMYERKMQLKSMGAATRD